VSVSATPPPIPYGEIDAAVAYPEAAPPTQDLNDRRRVDWTCPRCRHASTTTLSWGWAAALDGGGEEEERPHWRVIYCQCDEPHPAEPGEPAGNGVGCGCFIEVQVMW
jgi:hypothetical protein